MADKKIKVLYIAGSGRSGSTILGRILGQVDGFFFAGELCKIWRYGLMENRLCGCGLAFKDCSFWNDILHEAFGGQEKIDGREIYKLRRKSAYMRHIPFLLIPGGKSLLSSRLNQFMNKLEKLYHAIQFHTNCRVIVDCSKTAPYGYVLNSIDSIDLYVVHIVRDPRGVAFSKLEKNLYQPGYGNPIYAGQSGIIKSSVTWDIQNLAAEVFWKKSDAHYIRIFYEDFVVNTQENIIRIIDMLKENKSGLPFVGEQQVNLDEKTHTVAGNPVRFNSGIVEIRPDIEWTRKMNQRKQFLIKLFAWPIFIKYKYHQRNYKIENL
jgi:hypothetical protein